MPLPDIALTKDDFDRCRWQDVIARCSNKECLYYYQLFFTEAKDCKQRGDARAEAVFALLAAATSLMPKLDSKDEPFGPMAVMNNFRSAILDDFNDTHLHIFEELVPHVVDPEMRARITDILWIKRRDHRMARLAVESYLESAKVLEDPEHWPPCADRINRAVQLAAVLGRNQEPFSSAMAHVEAVLEKYKGEDPLFLSARMMQILQEHQRGDPPKYATLAAKLANRAEASRGWHRARTYWEVKAKWHALQKDAASQEDALKRAAETYVWEAEDAITQTSPSYMAASSHLQKAIAALRKIKGTKTRIDELHEALLEYEKKTLDEMKSVSTELDLGPHIEKVREQVKGKTIEDALFILALLVAPPKVGDLRKRVQELVKRHPLQYLVSATTVNSEGKIVARRSSMLSTDTDEAENAMREEMFAQAAFSQQIHAQAVIEPAREQILLEHNVRVDDLLSIMRNSPFIPEGREYIYAKGLHAGLIGDFLTAAHLLIPQLENSIRWILSQRGIFTSGLNAEGIQEEYDINRILKLPELRVELEKIFGEDLAFDLRGLLVERFGSNVRNLAAHGLMDSGAFFSPQISYLWWLVLHLCCVPLIAQTRKNRDSPQEPPIK